PAYTRNVNPGIPQVATLAGLALFLSHAAETTGRPQLLALACAGCLAGLGYTLDSGSGPPLLAAALVAVALRTRQLRPTAVFLLTALPWVVFHHAVNYAVGGVLLPINMVPEYLDWPGSP